MEDAEQPTVGGVTPVGRLRTLALATVVGLAGLLLGAVLSIGTVLLLAFAGVQVGIVTILVVSLVLTQGVAFGGVALVYLQWRDLGPEFIAARLPSGRDLLWVVGGYLLALAAAYVGALVATTTGLEPASNQVGEIGIENPEVLLLLVPLSFLLIGPGEELLFRGVVQGTIRQRFGPAVGVALASIIFAGIHWFALTGGTGARLVTIGILFFPSLVFGAAYERTGNVVVPALIHGAYNATLFGLVYVAIRMGQLQAAVALPV